VVDVASDVVVCVEVGSKTLSVLWAVPVFPAESAAE